jgi:ribosomal protein L11 methyltransferase
VIAFELTVPGAAEDAATLLLWEHGTAGVEVRAAGAATVLLAYFEARDGLEERLRHALAGIAGAGLARTDVPIVDWVARYREGFRAFHAGGFLIAPCWDVPPAATEPVLIVDPGQAFGTGTHESTRLCLDALATLCTPAPPASVLDVGTGSGILAVAAALRGARRVFGLDVDPEALRCARRHAALNRVAIGLAHADGAGAARAGAFDLVLANVSAALLHEARDELVAARAPGGALVLSGFLTEDAGRLADAYAEAGRVERLHQGEWSALVVRAGP